MYFPSQWTSNRFWRKLNKFVWYDEMQNLHKFFGVASYFMSEFTKHDKTINFSFSNFSHKPDGPTKLTQCVISHNKSSHGLWDDSRVSYFTHKTKLTWWMSLRLKWINLVNGIACLLSECCSQQLKRV